MRSTKRWYALCAALLLLGLLGTLLVNRLPRGDWAEVLQDGTLICRLDLREAQTLTVTSSKGGYNILEVGDGTVRVVEASCPDHSCVHMGSLSKNGFPIVCLPNRLVIQYAREGGIADALAS